MRTPTALLALAVLLLGCPKKEEAPDASAAPRAPSPPTLSRSDVPAQREEAVPTLDAGRAETESETACVDRWLKERKLDEYGNPEGTMYAGGSPLFDERTGESRDRLAFVYERQPEVKTACKAAGP